MVKAGSRLDGLVLTLHLAATALAFAPPVFFPIVGRGRAGLRLMLRANMAAEEIVEFGKQTDFKRPAQPEELSPAYVFLASPVCSSYITGIVLPVTGKVGG